MGLSRHDDAHDARRDVGEDGANEAVQDVVKPCDCAATFHRPGSTEEAYIAVVDSLPNLELLDGLPIIEKQATLPSDRLKGPHFPDAKKRETYRRDNDLIGLPLQLDRFLDCHQQRRDRVASRMRELLEVPSSGSAGRSSSSCE